VVVALPELLWLAALIVALGMITVGTAFTEALFKVTESGIGWIPWIGKKAANGVDAVRQRLTSYMGEAALGLQGTISASWNVLAQLVEDTGAALWDAARATAHLAWLVEVKYPLDVLSALAHRAQGVVNRTTKITATTVKRITVVQGVSAAQWKRVAGKVARLEARVAAIPYAGAGAIALPFPRIGRLERQARREAGELSRLAHRLDRLPFAAAVAGALAALGVSWARKPCAKRTADAWCRVDPDLFDSIFAATTLIVGSISLVQLSREVGAVLPFVANATAGFVRETQDTWKPVG
jgi:hypothetical protein